MTPHLSPVQMGLALIGLALLFAATVPAVWFPIQYRKSNWREFASGRGLMWSQVSLAIVLVLTVMFQFVMPGGLTVALVVQIGAMGFLAYAEWRMLRHLRRVQRQGPQTVPEERQNQEQNIS